MTTDSSELNSGPLYGLQVIEFAGLGPAPLAGQLLADQGAEVVSVERQPVAPDPTDVNRRGKHSRVLDLKTPAGHAAAVALATEADVLIEAYRPGVMEQLGLGPNDLPDHLIYARMTGWGQNGPLAHCAGHDINYLALTGALHAIGEAKRPPVPPLNLVADYGGGAMFLLFGILAALFERTRSGKGQVIDAAMVDGVPAMMGLLHGLMASGQWQEQRQSNLLDGGAPFYRCYQTADDRYVAVGALEPKFFAVLGVTLGLSEDDIRRQYDREHWPALHTTLAARFCQRTRDHWVTVFEGTDACVTPVLTIAEAAQHPHIAHRGSLTTIATVLQAGIAPRFSRTAGTCTLGFTV